MLLNEGGGTATRTMLFLLSEGRGESTTGVAAFANSWSFHPAMLEMLVAFEFHS
jgi:hypothetical protein